MDLIDDFYCNLLNYSIKYLKLRRPNATISEKLNYSKGNVSSFMNGKKPMPETFLENFFKTFNLDREAMEKGLRNNIEAYKINDLPKIRQEQGIGRPFYDVDFTLGVEELDNDITLYPEFNIDFPPANKEGVNWYRGKGNSMLGEIDSGDYIALKEIKDFSWFPLGRIYGIVTNNNFRTIKRIIKPDNKDEYLLVSTNPDKTNYPDQPIPKNVIEKLFKILFVIKDLDE